MATFTSTYHRAPYPAIDPTAPQNSMSGRSILIAGATGGIGLATAHAYLKASPAFIVILGRRKEALSAAVTELENARPASSTAKIVGKQCDISDQKHIERLWADLHAQNIPIGVLVLNAAAMTSNTATRLSDIIPFLDMNVAAGLRMADHFLAQGPPTGKVLINVSSMAAHVTIGDQLSNSAYSASKAAGAAAFQFAADCKAVEEVQIINVHPGAILTDSARKSGYDEGTIPWDEPALPGSFFVWASTQQAAFLHGRFVWCHWDVDELVAMKPRLESDPGFLRIGLQGMPSVTVTNTFGTIAEWDRAAKSAK